MRVAARWREITRMFQEDERESRRGRENERAERERERDRERTVMEAEEQTGPGDENEQSHNAERGRDRIPARGCELHARRRDEPTARTVGE